MSLRRPVVVTGIGMLSPLGIGLEANWDALKAGTSGIAPVTRFDTSQFPTKIAGEVKDFDPLSVVDRKQARTLDRFELYALASAREAVEDATIDISQGPEKTAVVFGVGLGGIESMERFHTALEKGGPRRVSPFLVPMMIPNMAASHISLALGTRGPCEVVTTACASGAHAIASGMRWIQEGIADVVIAGGAEAAITPLSFAGFCSMRALSRRNDEPESACRPFDKTRDGFVLAEGAAALVLESEESARSRGASVYAELAGCASTADSFHITQPDPEGVGQARCMSLALENAGLKPEDVGYINAHGTGTDQNDKAESLSIHKAFGSELSEQIPVSSTKSMTGHLLGAAGAIESAFCCLALSRNVIPPTINLENPDPQCPLNHIRIHSIEKNIDVALSNSFGFGGTNATVVMRTWH